MSAARSVATRLLYRDGIYPRAPRFSASTPLPSVERAKAAAGHAAVAHSFKPEQHKVIGIGSGSTIIPVVEAFGALPPSVLQDKLFIPTGMQSSQLIRKFKLRLGSLDDLERWPRPIDIAFDGADDVDANLEVIKGGGACHLREKVIMHASRHNIIVADARKNSEILGVGLWNQGVPVEVVPYALDYVLNSLARLEPSSHKLSERHTATLRMGGFAKAGPVLTDNGNFVLDVVFPSSECLAASCRVRY
ncbi:ribose 5-phosphate isomerase A-domain-containing protein [Leucosporidium creatinivorum]|uniref:Ribose-5-phosphate isomerase n=1 Tax=Leucosporidium creatinivorum TaxID=106004 RepID=A0A1Y2DMB0_9BASI|nr:ribose 5-phosphate isomerase A-domain-containing protein [Leucosporidium creatinivorum]